MLNILAISGSLRAASTNSALVAALTQNAPPDCHVSVYDGLGRLPIFNPDDEGERTPPQAAALIDAVPPLTASSSPARNTHTACQAA
ncbi:NAD(P)H-dependent oxidoreductase [Mesorhizobium sp. M0340]|uniref:NADPH-dependent FMN reductase n=1 Tax=Mesorhizobium sp. M0340 TaxID=2956939 RepID=UPI003338DA23